MARLDYDALNSTVRYLMFSVFSVSPGQLGEEREAVVQLEGLDQAVGIVQTLSVEDRRDLLARLVDAASADGRMSPHELATVKRVAAALGIDQ